MLVVAAVVVAVRRLPRPEMQLACETPTALPANEGFAGLKAAIGVNAFESCEEMKVN